MNISKLEYPNGYPERLRPLGKAIDSKFDPNEELYLRFLQVSPITGRPDFGEIRCPDLSVNRSKYSAPEDVLWSSFTYLMHWGIGSLRVHQATFDLFGGDGIVIKFLVEHDPVLGSEEFPENYSHCEVRAYKLGVRRPALPAKVKLEFRQRIAESIVKLKDPTSPDAS